MARMLQELSLAELIVKSEKADNTLKGLIKDEIDKRKPSREEMEKAEREFNEVRNRANEPLPLFGKIWCVLFAVTGLFKETQEDLLINWEYGGYDRKLAEHRLYTLFGVAFWAVMTIVFFIFLALKA